MTPWTKRDYNRVVLAEDDIDRAVEMMQLLQSLGGYEVTFTRRRAAVEGLLEDSCAGWLVLDLNLVDGSAAVIVPALRQRYGRDLLILVLSGYYEEFPEYELLRQGVDLYLRKPYPPQALLQQMATLRARLEGQVLRQQKGLRLAVGDGVLDIDDGTLRRPGQELTLPRGQARLMALLASARDEHGWIYLSRAQIIAYMWGENAYEDPAATVGRLRKLRYRLRKRLGMRILEEKTSGTGPLPGYRLASSVRVLAGPDEGEET